MGPYAKAIVAFFLPGALVVAEAIQDGKGSDMPTASEWLLALVISVVTAGGVFTVENKPRRR